MPVSNSGAIASLLRMSHTQTIELTLLLPSLVIWFCAWIRPRDR
jgi:hypothetical protein